LKREGKNPRAGPDHFPQVPYVEPTFVIPPAEGGDGNESKDHYRKPNKFMQREAS
jgi:hypothetical protein